MNEYTQSSIKHCYCLFKWKLKYFNKHNYSETPLTQTTSGPVKMFSLE